MKVIKKQKNSKNCIICGLNNELGVKASFYDLEDGSIGALFTFKLEHQSYPERVHGGMSSALLDELMGRVIWVSEPTTYAVTTSMQVSFRKPVPYNTPLKARAEITFNSLRGYSAKGEIYTLGGELLCSATAKYVKLPEKLITKNFNMHEEMAYLIEDGVTEIDF